MGFLRFPLRRMEVGSHLVRCSLFITPFGKKHFQEIRAQDIGASYSLQAPMFGDAYQNLISSNLLTFTCALGLGGVHLFNLHPNSLQLSSTKLSVQLPMSPLLPFRFHHVGSPKTASHHHNGFYKARVERSLPILSQT